MTALSVVLFQSREDCLLFTPQISVWDLLRIFYAFLGWFWSLDSVFL